MRASPFHRSTAVRRSRVERGLTAEFHECGLQVVARTFHIAQFDQCVALVLVQFVPLILCEIGAEIARVGNEAWRRCWGWRRPAAYFFREFLGGAARTRHGSLFDEQLEGGAFLRGRRRGVTDHQALTTPQLLPLGKMHLDSDRIELPPGLHRDAAQRLIDFRLELKLANHVSVCSLRAWPRSYPGAPLASSIPAPVVQT